MRKFIFILLVFLLTKNLFSQDTLIFKRNYIPYPDTTIVFIPTNYNNSSEPIPLIFLLHGWSGKYNQWSNLINLQKYANEYNFIIVCPDGFYDSWYMNNAARPNYQFDTFFWKDLVPKLLMNYHVDIKNIFISGLSMGGHGALTLFFKNPFFFKSAGSTSGILDLSEFSGKWNLDAALGNKTNNEKFWKENSAIKLVENIKGLNKPFIFDCGTEDFAFRVNKKFYKVCKSMNLVVKFITQAGNHSSNYWKKSIKNHFVFFKKLTNE